MESELYWVRGITVDALLAVGAPEESIFENIGGTDLTQVELTKEQAHKLIPRGPYCYTRRASDGVFKPCPFWDMIEQFPHQGNGYCTYLRRGDDAMGGLLWDQIKECSINDPDDYDEP